MCSKNQIAASDRIVQKSAYRWNTVAGLLGAFQSVIILMVIARACDVYAAGIFTLAYATGNLFLNMGKYGMRQYQVSDRDERFGFGDYRSSRITTTVAMMVTSFAYIAYLAVSVGYSPDKTACIIALCLYEAVGSLEDVYHGNFQQHGRLDVGARLLAARTASTVTLICLIIGITGTLLPGIVAGVIWTACFLAFELAWAKKRYGLPAGKGSPSRKQVLRLLRSCFPLFAAAFLLFYIGNAPRYAIDAIMNDAAQAYYGYIAMPVFVVVLLAGFIYNPMVASLADQWREGKTAMFVRRFLKVALAVFGLTLLCDAAAFLVGIPVLDLLYNADTSPYLPELLILVTGGGFLALATLSVLGITIIRFQRVLLPVYLVAAVCAWALSNWMVATWGISGAAWCYFACMAALALVLSSLLAVGIRMYRKPSKSPLPRRYRP